MSKPFKLKINQFFSELLCPHRNVKYRNITINRDYLVAECKECGKSWVE